MSRTRPGVVLALFAVMSCGPVETAGRRPNVSPVPTPSPVVAVSGPEALARARKALADNDYAVAEREFASVPSGPERPAALLGLAKLQLFIGRYDDAAASAGTAATLSKEGREEATLIRAKALAARGKLGEAIAVLKELEGDPAARRARLLLGELLIRAGQRVEAKAPLLAILADFTSQKIPDTDAAGMATVGRAAHLLQRPRAANDAYDAAERAGGKGDVELLLNRVELLLEKYNTRDAWSAAREALKLAPRDPRVHVAVARVKLQDASDFQGAESELRQALEVNPNLAEAYFVRAGLALRDMDTAAADQAADRGLEVNPKDLELLSIKAAARLLADDRAGFANLKRAVLAQNPGYSTFFRIVGEFAEWEHRYGDIVALMREAVAVDKDDAQAYGALGLNLLRAGEEDEGLAALKTSFRGDRYNVRVYNTLNLYDTIAREYVTVRGERFHIRYRKDEKAILERYVPRMLDEAWSSMVERYGFTPRRPVWIELYADAGDFSLRTSGLPNVGIQGVCFGSTLAAMSPKAGEFNWGILVWHELAHVFAIQMSDNHVPRWFTEGLSEYETSARRPEWQREEDASLFLALKGGRVPPVEAFNRAFTHVDTAKEVGMAYHAASQLVAFAVKEFGFPKVASMLRRWASGERTAQVIQGSLGIGPAELDRRFRAWLGPRLDRYNRQYVPDLFAPPLADARKSAREHPKDPQRQVQLALALLEGGQRAEGGAALADALKLDPRHPDAGYVSLRLALVDKDVTEAERVVAKMLADGNDGYAVRMRAADLAEVRGDAAAQKRHLESAQRLDPSQVEPLQALYDLARKAHDARGELAALKQLAALDEHDRRVWGLLLERLVEAGEWEEARKVGESALFVDVHSWKMHRLYARALEHTGRASAAAYELESALVCNPESPAEQAAIYGELVTLYTKLKEPAKAKSAREKQKRLGGRR